MIDPDRYILAHLAGAHPPAPRWHAAAIAQHPERGQVDVDGAAIEWRAWGPIGTPGLLLVHGGWAHAGWWSHIAPLLAQDRRVAALSLSGMGQSGWRDRYTILQYGRELRAVAVAAGLDRAGPPIVAGHSFGCAATLAAVADPADWTAGIILIDGSITMKVDDRPAVTGRRGRPFASVDAALARFRLMPPQPCTNLFVVDGIARESLRQSPDGLIWSFDPTLYERCAFVDTRALAMAASRPIAFIRGAESAIVTDAVAAGLRADLPAMRFVTIPGAHHHVMIDQPLALVSAIEAILTDSA